MCGSMRREPAQRVSLPGTPQDPPLVSQVPTRGEGRVQRRGRHADEEQPELEQPQQQPGPASALQTTKCCWEPCWPDAAAPDLTLPTRRTSISSALTAAMPTTMPSAPSYFPPSTTVS